MNENANSDFVCLHGALLWTLMKLKLDTIQKWRVKRK